MMKGMKHIFVSLSAILIVGTLGAQELWVAANEGLVLRSAPRQDGKQIGLIPKGTKVFTVNGKGAADPETIENIKAHWVSVSFGSQTGFVFRGFLSQFQPWNFNETGEEYFRKISKNGKFKVQRTSNNAADGGGGYSGGYSITISNTHLAEVFLTVRGIAKEFANCKFRIPCAFTKPYEINGKDYFQRGKISHDKNRINIELVTQEGLETSVEIIQLAEGDVRLTYDELM